MFVEFLRAYFAMLLVFATLGGVVLLVGALNLERGDQDGSILHMDLVSAGIGIAMISLCGFVIPKWFSGWAKPSLTSESAVRADADTNRVDN